MNNDWTSLKRKFITRNKGNEKYTLKQFAEDEKINYKTLRENAKGWIKERQARQRQKSDKITEKIFEEQIASEIEINRHHYEMANRLLDVMGQTFDVNGLVTAPKSIYTLAKSLKALQDVQRKACGLDEKEKGGSSVIKDFIKAVEDENSN